MKTTQNLKDAFAGESQANRKYLAFATKASKEGFPQVAKLFRAVAEAETIHAHAHLKALDGVDSTVENLKSAMEGEKYEFTEMYPSFLIDAEKEGNKRALNSMKKAMETEKVHYELYGAALDAVKDGKDMVESEVHICDICGHTVIGSPPDRCPICNAKKEKYTEIQ